MSDKSVKFPALGKIQEGHALFDRGSFWRKIRKCVNFYICCACKLGKLYIYVLLGRRVDKTHYLSPPELFLTHF